MKFICLIKNFIYQLHDLFIYFSFDFKKMSNSLKIIFYFTLFLTIILSQMLEIFKNNYLFFLKIIFKHVIEQNLNVKEFYFIFKI